MTRKNSFALSHLQFYSKKGFFNIEGIGLFDHIYNNFKETYIGRLTVPVSLFLANSICTPDAFYGAFGMTSLLTQSCHILVSLDKG